MSTEDVAIKVEGVYKDFKLPHLRKNTLKSIFTGLFERKKSKSFEVQHALKDISFEVKKGEFFGIVGRNGSGKSTLLKILATIYQPTKGNITINGKLVPFIELGVGFNPELTGRENVYLNGALLGFSVAEIDELYNDIVEFAELEKFMDQKLKNYSSGMQVRLAFSMATRANTDILLVDEVLAVGDADFQRKCFDYFKQLRKNKKTVIFVTHDMNAVREYCDRAILINDSRIIESDRASKIASSYTKLFMDGGESSKSSEKTRWGDQKMLITKIECSPKSIDEDIQSIDINLQVEVKETIENPIVGFSVSNAAGSYLFGTNTRLEGHEFGTLRKGHKLNLSWEVPNIFNTGIYTVDCAIVHDDSIGVHDWWEGSASFKAIQSKNLPYILAPKIKLNSNKER